MSGMSEAEQTVFEVASDLSAEQRLLQGLEEKVRACKARIHELRTQVLPDLMVTAGINRIDTSEHSISMGYYFTGSFPSAESDPERHDRALAYLADQDASELYKATVTNAFQRRDVAAAMAFADETGGKLSLGVHPSTLKAWARERMSNGEPVDLGAIGLSGGLAAQLRDREGA